MAIRKHACPDCSSRSRILPSPWWAEGKRFEIIGRHIHTGEVGTLYATNDAEKANQLLALARGTCTSHEHITLIKHQ
jgi:hypothetical protein